MLDVSKTLDAVFFFGSHCTFALVSRRAGENRAARGWDMAGPGTREGEKAGNTWGLHFSVAELL